MKNLLIATTALVATATVAAADVKFSGYGRFGAKYTEGTAAVAGKALTTSQSTTTATIAADGTLTAGTTTAAVASTTDATDAQKLAAVNAVAAAKAALAAAATPVAIANAEAALADAEADLAVVSDTAAVDDDITAASRLRLQIDMSAASDNGLSFGARYRIQAEENAGNAANAARFTVSAGGLTIGAGNIGGAIEFMSGLYAPSASGGMGLEGNGFISLATNVKGAYWKWDAYDSAGAGVVNGVEAIYSTGGLTLHVSSTEDSRTAAALTYSAGDLMVGVAMSDSDTAGEDKTLATVKYTMGASSIQLSYADNDGTDKTVLRAATSMGGMSVYGFVGDEDTAGVDTTYGLGLSYALGGGTSFEAGMASNEDGRTTADAGFLFKF